MQTIERPTEEAPAAKQTGHKPFQPKEIFKQAVISTLAVAPDASSIVYVKRTVDDGKYVRRLWRTSFKGGRADQLTSANANDGRPRFSPDGKALLFISDRSGKPQVWVMPMTGGEPQKLTDLPSGVNAAEWSPDGQRLLLLAPSGEKRFIVGNADDPVARKIRDYTWRFDGAGYRDEFTSAWFVEIATGKARRITAPTYNVESAAWSPDGKHIAFAADLRPEAALEETPEVWTLPVQGTVQPQHVAKLQGAVFAVAWAPLPEIAFMGIDKPHTPWWADMELHVAGKGRIAAGRGLNPTNSTYGDFQDGDVLGPPPLQVIDKENILALVAHKGESHPYRFGVRGDVEALARPEATCVAIATGGGKVAVAAAAGGPTEVYAVEKGSLRPLTVDGGRWFIPFKRPIERVAIRHSDGHTIDTWLLTAKGQRTKAPLVLDVHGGPNASFGPTPWLEMNALADAGLHVIWCNPRGSVGYGEEYSKAVHGRWGEPDSTDLLTVIDWAIEQGLTDREQIGIMGLSYGGFMTTWMLGHHPGVFKAAVSENPVTDMLSEYANADGGRFIGMEAVGKDEPWEHLQEFLDKSPYTKIHLNHAPLLLLQAENDLRCPPVNSEMVFNILRTLGREVEMIRYPAESHVMFIIGRPDRRVDRMERIVDWFKKHVAPSA
jgi:dipeptidyl aminopeptidase/acylaminoacyl peptidase